MPRETHKVRKVVAFVLALVLAFFADFYRVNSEIAEKFLDTQFLLTDTGPYNSRIRILTDVMWEIYRFYVDF